jgi:CRP-like cAMP-binding protein
MAQPAPAAEAAPFSRSSLLGSLPADDLRDLARAGERRSWRAGARLFQRGDSSDGLYAITAGHVRVFIEHADGDEIELAVRGAGETLGEMAVLDGQGRSASAAAQDESAALWIPAGRFRTWLVTHPHATAAMLEQLARRLREATDQVGELALLDVEARIARRLWRAFAELGARPGDSIAVNQAELAAALSITRESVNKHLGRLKASGVVDVAAGRVTLRSPEALRALAEDAL